MRGRQRRWRPARGFRAGAVLLVAAFFAALWAGEQFRPVTPNSHAVRYVKVVPGSSADQVAVSLHQAGVIRSVWAFEVLSRLKHLSTSLTAGVYRLSPDMSPSTILRKMKAGDTVVIRVAIPEGFSVQQIVTRLEKAHIGTPAQYRVLESKPLPGMPQPGVGVRDPLEGYLFPATYSFPYGTTARQALQIMWKTFQQRVVQGLYDKTTPHLSLSQWVTLASIMQAEDSSGYQARDVAAVFYNRLAANMPLQSDATVRYAIGKPIAGGLTFADLATNSPYNTYQHQGLPPGPIDNPGVAILQAALHPSPVHYLYFLSLRDGKIVFATTYQQHLANIAQAESRQGN